MGKGLPGRVFVKLETYNPGATRVCFCNEF
jgi:hypothetical protein